MPEYLAPGVYVEEVSFRAKSIEGVPTSTTGFTGMTRTGPVPYRDPGAETQLGPTTTDPRLITSFTEYERVYGGIDNLVVDDGTDPGTFIERTNYMAYAAKAFFDNGGRRLYVSRVFKQRDDPNRNSVASLEVPVGGGTATWRARWPGSAGNVAIEVIVNRSRNIAYLDNELDPPRMQVRRARDGAVIEIAERDSEDDPLPSKNDELVEGSLLVVRVGDDGVQRFFDANGEQRPTLPKDGAVQLIELTVRVHSYREVFDEYADLGADPQQKRYIGRILEAEDPDDQDAMVYLDWEPGAAEFEPARLMIALQTPTGQPQPVRLIGGDDGVLAVADDIGGREGDLDNPKIKATGLEALAEIDDIAIVAAPDSGTYDDVDQARAAAGRLIAHAEKVRYRIAVLDGPRGSSISEIRDFRGNFDSTRAALYHPWIEVFAADENRNQGAVPRRILLPPSGFVCGIYARNDITRGVHKAPANEVVRGLTRFEANINHSRQEVLNPEGINALRFFEGRGHRVWGARTISSDPEWKYVNVRRLFIFIEASIDRGTQWAVFEPNNSRLWGNLKRGIEDFLYVLWKDGALMGKTPEEAFFVRIDRTTMTQNDIDNGRMIALIGVAPVKPAEFVIFRIGQWTGDATFS
jgi:phage tail sheath protein FI